MRYPPHPRHSAKRVCMLLKTKRGSAEKTAKSDKEPASCKPESRRLRKPDLQRWLQRSQERDKVILVLLGKMKIITLCRYLSGLPALDKIARGKTPRPLRKGKWRGKLAATRDEERNRMARKTTRGAIFCAWAFARQNLEADLGRSLSFAPGTGKACSESEHPSQRYPIRQTACLRH